MIIRSMKQIRFKRLSLLNFCGIRQMDDVFFGDSITTISGGNGLGKSTIFNAITYCLFGKNSKGMALDIKTYDREHKIIREIPHEVTLVLTVDDREITLKRTLTDVWKGDQVSNTYKYFINGEVATAGDFKKAVDNICPETTFRLCSSATDFVSRPWADQRRFLESLIPEIDEGRITGNNPIYDFVEEALHEETIDKLLHHLRYQRKEIQAALNKVPVRLAELDKALPPKEDWEAAEARKKELGERMAPLDSKILQMRTGGADKVLKDGIREKIAFQQKRKRNMEQGALNLSTDQATKHQSDILTVNAEVRTAQSVIGELKAKMQGYTDTEIHAKKQKEECEMKVKDFNDRMNALCSRTWSWNDKDSFCPHCLQPLPLDKLATMKEESRKRFNEAVAEEKKQLQEDFGKLQHTYTELKKILEQVDEERIVTTNQLVKAQQALKDAEKHMAEVEQDSPKTYEQLLAENESYRQAADEIAKLEQELNAPSADCTDELKALEQERTGLGIEYNKTLDVLSSKQTYDRINALIEDAHKDLKMYQEQLDNLDDKITVANDYYQHSCDVLEQDINKMFSYVKWTMFQSTQDGERKPYCECHHDGVPYGSLNAAAKINAGIDIANVVSKFYDVSVPMILDECESNLHPIYEGGQQIRLCVSPSPKLEISYGD